MTIGEIIMVDRDLCFCLDQSTLTILSLLQWQFLTKEFVYLLCISQLLPKDPLLRQGEEKIDDG